jgi:uncharacterized protein (TIGR04255 family)
MSELNFKSPPIVEVALSIQFRTLSKFHAALLGEVWREFRSDYPHISYANKLEHQIERFGASQPVPQHRLTFSDFPETPRAMFASNSNEYLIQVQEDRFILNWRKLEGFVYPKHERLSQILFKEFERFKRVIGEFDVGDVTPDQIEITNVNHIETAEQSVSKIFDGILSNVGLSKEPIEGFNCAFTKLYKRDEQDVGRIYTQLEKSKRRHDFQDIYVVKITGRAQPKQSNTDAMRDDFSQLRLAINRVFDTVTSSTLHNQWGKQ